MSQESFVAFLERVAADDAMRHRYRERNLEQLLFHAKNEGFALTAEDVASVVGALEADVILVKDGDAFDGDSRLWRSMWGLRHLDYLLDAVTARYTEAELRGFLRKLNPAVTT
jgi:predicted ribosomally synthesized peptide with nif11-like leader